MVNVTSKRMYPPKSADIYVDPADWGDGDWVASVAEYRYGRHVASNFSPVTFSGETELEAECAAMTYAANLRLELLGDGYHVMVLHDGNEYVFTK